ncbi:MAG: hypothetical protein ACRDQI_15255 [Pseudonocardiaceae bacterium]
MSDVEGASKLTTTWVKPSELASVVSIRRVLSSPRRVRSLVEQLGHPNLQRLTLHGWARQ